VRISGVGRCYTITARLPAFLQESKGETCKRLAGVETCNNPSDSTLYWAITRFTAVNKNIVNLVLYS